MARRTPSTWNLLSAGVVAWPVLVRMDARRAATWLGVVAAFAATWSRAPAAVVAAAALATVAAVGDVPGLTGARMNLVWLAERAAWPLLGAVAGAAVQWLAVGGSASAAGIAMIFGGLAAITIWCLRTSQVPAADAASVTLLIAFVAAATIEHGGSTATVAAVWGGLATCMAVAMRFTPAMRWGEERLPRSAGEMMPGGLSSRGPLRRLLGRGAMITMLAAMAGWLMLDSDKAALAAAVGSAWMVCLAVPAALLGGGGEAAWFMLLRSAAGSPGCDGPRPPLAAPGRRTIDASYLRPHLGPRRMVFEVAVWHAAVLGWPALVAAAVMAPSSPGPWPGLFVAAGIAVVALVLSMVGVICFSWGASRETAHAFVLALVAGAVLLLAGDRENASRWEQRLLHPAQPGGAWSLNNPLLSPRPLPATLILPISRPTGQRREDG